VAPGEGVIATFRGPHASQRHPGGLKRAHWPRGTERVGRRRRFWRRHAVRLKMTSRRASQGFSPHLSTESRNLQCSRFWRTPAWRASKSVTLAQRRHRLRGRYARQERGPAAARRVPDRSALQLRLDSARNRGFRFPEHGGRATERGRAEAESLRRRRGRRTDVNQLGAISSVQVTQAGQAHRALALQGDTQPEGAAGRLDEPAQSPPGRRPNKDNMTIQKTGASVTAPRGRLSDSRTGRASTP
jgi:hypothetical protein